MKNFSVFKPLNAPDITYKELEISIIYTLGGYNYFSDQRSARGIYCHLNPCTRANGMVSSTMLGSQRESGYKFLLEELPRKSQKRIDHWAKIVESKADEIAKLYELNENQKLVDLVRGVESAGESEQVATPYVLKITGEKVALPNTELETLQKAVDGYIEIVPARNGQAIILDEEGKLKNKPVNRFATAMYVNGQVDPIVGDVVIANADQVK